MITKNGKSSCQVHRPISDSYVSLSLACQTQASVYLTAVVNTTELSMGPFCVNRSNPTHQLTDPIQSNPLQVEKFGSDPIQLLSVSLLSAEFADQIFISIAIVDPTEPNPPKTEKSRPNPTRPNSTQPIDNSETSHTTIAAIFNENVATMIQRLLRA